MTGFGNSTIVELVAGGGGGGGINWQFGIAGGNVGGDRNGIPDAGVPDAGG